MKISTCLASVAIACASPALANGPLQVQSKVLVETRTANPDGTVKVQMVPAKKVTPGDRVIFVVSYRNVGSTAISDVVIANPVPSAIAYRSFVTPGNNAEVSVDGRQYGQLGTLKLASASGARMATAADVTHVRWKLSGALAPGSSGELMFAGVLK